ncbi:hypothetical protein J3R30DRAFT_2751119 [Lentinula aciculospora]|uniref:Uncharacterized protein n=1 Tax=Lentinula aciculospora TaxID=153920 RepID=A0A9W9AC69_9AGAR|nr:hypothetical protein J3R30DRAFT_2751119 [Lentinula aciculospora]
MNGPSSLFNPEIYTYPPSVSSSPIPSLAVTPDASESHTSDSYFSSPEEGSPLPPLTLLDQLHMAYALDDLPLAKILLLKITQDVQDITSRTDPRLDAVKPEDFDVAFLPKGGLMTPDDEARLAERQEKERKRLQKKADEAREQARQHKEKVERERQEQEEREQAEKEERERLERERAWEGWVENIWGNAKREMDEMKELREVARKRQEDAERVCQRQEDEKRRVIAERRRNHTTKGSVSTPVPRISYAHLSTTRLDLVPPLQTELLYTLPSIPKLSTQRSRVSRTSDAVPSFSTNCMPIHPCSLRKTTPPSSSSFLASSDSFNDSNSASSSDVGQRLPPAISVQELLTAMRGELFPAEFVQPEERDCSQHTLHGRNKSGDFDLGVVRQRSKTPNHSLNANSLSSSRYAVTRKQKRDDALLAELLLTSNDTRVDRLRNRRANKGKGKALEAGRRKKSPPLRMICSVSVTSATSKSVCTACSARLTSPSTTSSSSGASRSGNWLSFMSSSSVSSASTALTTPSASTSGSSPPAKPSMSVFSTWLKGVTSQSSSLPVDQCTCDHLELPRMYDASQGVECRLVPVGKEESPLPLDILDPAVISSPALNEIEASAIAQSEMAPHSPMAAGSKTLLGSVTHFLDVAKNFQSAYMHAAMFAALASVPNVSSFGNEWDREYEIRQAEKRSKAAGDHGGSEIRQE